MCGMSEIRQKGGETCRVWPWHVERGRGASNRAGGASKVAGAHRKWPGCIDSGRGARNRAGCVQGGRETSLEARGAGQVGDAWVCVGRAGGGRKGAGSTWQEACEAVGASRCIRVVVAVVGQRWASRDASGSVGLAWGHVRRQGGVDGSGARRVGRQHVVQGPGVSEGRAGVLRRVVSGRGGGRQGGPCPGRAAGRIASGEAAARGGLGAWLRDVWAALGRTWARVVAAEG